MIPLPDDVRKNVEKQSSLFAKVMKSSLKMKEEKILIISDYGAPERLMAPMVAYGYYHAARQKGYDVSLLFQEMKKGFMQMDDHVLKALHALPAGNVVIIAMSHKVGRIGKLKSFRTFCREQRHRFLSATGLSDVNPSHFSLFLDAMNVNYKRMKRQGLAIKKIWDKANMIHVKTEAGTDVTFDIAGMEAVANVGEYHEPGMGGNMPSGEVYIPPRGLTGVSGKIVIDGSIKTLNGAILVDEPLILYVEQGKVIRMEGKYAEIFEKTLEHYENRAKFDERVRLIGELGIGINPGAVLIGSTIIDEKVMGTAHIAVGSNYWFGGQIKTIFHADLVFKNPQFYVDGKRMEI